jgi:hypothetical protein
MNVLLRVVAIFSVCVLSPNTSSALGAQQIAEAFGYSISPLISQQQRTELSPDFSGRFKVLNDLRVDALSSYIGAHPLELEAIHGYLQQLVNEALLDPEIALEALDLGIRQFSMRPLRISP